MGSRPRFCCWCCRYSSKYYYLLKNFAIMTSGAKVVPKLADLFHDFKMGNKNNLAYIIAKRDDEDPTSPTHGMIILDEAPEDTWGDEVDEKKVPKSYKAMTDYVEDKKTRWAFYNMKWENKQKIVFIQYISNDVKAKEAVPYSSSRDVIKKACGGDSNKCVEANDSDELDYFEILK